MHVKGARRAGTRALVLGVTVFGLLLPPQSALAADYWTVHALARDEHGREVPIREGDATLGAAKACQKHNFCRVRYIQYTIEGKGATRDEGGGRFKYTGHMIGGAVGDLTLIVIADQNRTTARGATPDGRAVGVITAYCQGMARCPDALNQSDAGRIPE